MESESTSFAATALDRPLKDFDLPDVDAAHKNPYEVAMGPINKETILRIHEKYGDVTKNGFYEKINEDNLKLFVTEEGSEYLKDQPMMNFKFIFPAGISKVDAAKMLATGARKEWDDMVVSMETFD